MDWFSANARDLPWRRTRDPYAVWVSEIMLQQTQVKTVIPYWRRWLRELPNLKAAAHASPDKIHKLWEGLGYYSRARNLQKAARQIVNGRRDELHESPFKNKIRDSQSSSLRFPERYDDVLALPGIGRYTAGAICSIAFNQPTPILDGNVIRVLTRIFGIGTNPREKKTNELLWKLADELVQNSKLKNKNSKICCSHLNQSLMELGALVCTPRNPQCGICPAQKLCVAFRENRVAALPNPGKRDAATHRRFAAFVAGRNGRFLVRQRPAGVINAHLWEFPNVEINPGRSRSRRQSAHYSSRNGQSRLTSAATAQKLDHEIALGAEQFGLDPDEVTPLCTIKHSITRYRITLEAFRADFGGTSYTSPHSKQTKPGARGARPSEIGVWKTPAQLQHLAFSSAHKKVLSQLVGPK
ncbi:MAG: A/G-specific adenine glycosylase [Limisphaerales bacterium]